MRLGPGGVGASLSRCQASLAESSELRESIQEEGGRDEETLHDFRRRTTGLQATSPVLVVS